MLHHPYRHGCRSRDDRTLSSCQTTGSPSNVQPVATVELPPAEAPLFRVGDKLVHREKDGRETTFEVINVDGETVDFQFQNEGCSWSVPKSSAPFGPSLKWDSCNGSTGTQKVKKQEGSLFPLQVGNSERWSFSGKAQGGATWSATRKCTVKGIANVTVPAGNYDTYHVVCTTSRSRHEWHYSPELRRHVTWLRSRRGAKLWYVELVSFTPGE